MRNGNGTVGNKRAGKCCILTTRMFLRLPPNREQNALPTQEDHRSRFYEHYHKEAEEYDREFMKKYDEDLNTTLIFVSFVLWRLGACADPPQAGLFSAVTSAFIIEVHSHLLPDPNDETAALLRVLIQKIDNTTFGNNPPALPQWTGPPQTIVQVQAMLFASLSVSLFSAFLAMLGKQWLNRYASTDVRGTAIDRSQNRQRKLDGIVIWYFDHVMESLPLMLQVALLLLGCALSHYLGGINVAVASVVLGVTLLGITFYLLIVVAGTTSESCPYQTPGARILRHVIPALRSAPPLISKLSVFVSSKLAGLVRASSCYSVVSDWWLELEQPWYSISNIISNIFTFLVTALVQLPFALVSDIVLLGFEIVLPLGFAVYCRLTGAHPQKGALGQQAIALDLRCISRMLQTSLDKFVHLSTLEYLTTVTTLAGFDPTIVADCFNAFVGCISVNDHEVVIVQGLEQLAAVSSLCFFSTVSHLLALDPASSVLEDVRQRYAKIFPRQAHFRGHQFFHTLKVIHGSFTGYRMPQEGARYFRWTAYEPSGHEHTIVARILLRVALFGYQETRRMRVPRWILRFVFHSLSQDYPPPPSVVADCLSIIAIDL